MGIREPISQKPAPEEIIPGTALMLLPAVAVDPQGHRVGYGGGYYDKYLEKHPELTKVAVVFSFQVYDSVPEEPYDIPLDGIVTEEGSI